MASSYKRLFGIRFRHTYYEESLTRDFSIIPLPQTQKLARQYKLIFRPKENGIDVLSLMREPNVPFIDLGDQNKLGFAIMLKNTDLLNITNLPVRQNNRQVYYMDNTVHKAHKVMKEHWSLVTPRPESFKYVRQSEANEITLKATGPFDSEHTVTMLRQGNEFQSLFELGNRPEGKYVLEATEDGEKKDSEAVYTSELLWQTRPFGLIDIFTNELDYSQSKTYQIRLSAKKSIWTYRVNLGKDYTGSNISIKDERESPEVLFKQVGNTSQIKGKTLTFRSYRINDPNKTLGIRFGQTPIKDFKLIIEKNGKKTEIGGLPNPAINQSSTEMHINI